MFVISYGIGNPYIPKYGFSHKTLEDLHRCCIDAKKICDSLDLPSYQHLFLWFIERLEDGLNVTERMSMIRGLAGLSSAEQALKVELTVKFSFYRHPITIERMDRFLGQFETTENIRSALKVLQGVKFFTLWQLSEIAISLLKPRLRRIQKIETCPTEISESLIKPNIGKTVICPLGDSTGSTAILGYLASHDASENLNFTSSIEDALNSTTDHDTIIFLDDCTLSGTQTINIVKELLGLRVLKDHHTEHCKELSPELKTKIKSRKIIFAFCIACDFALIHLRNELKNTGLQFKVIYGLLEHEDQKAFSNLSNISWSSPEERIHFEQYCSEIGYEILDEISVRKKWKLSRRKQSALGYSNFQRLLVFPYSVPKTTLTFLWCKGNDARRWHPLFNVPD